MINRVFSYGLGLLGMVSLSLSATGQAIFPTELAVLPSGLDGTSGLEFVSATSLWTHNDNGSGAFLYEIDQQGSLLRTLEITNAAAVDFEDMAQDNVGNLYVGDFGNKLNNRTDLKIYRIPSPDQITGTTVQADVIEFILPDQSEFPPPKGEENFDIESMFHFNGSLYLFTRNRGLSRQCKVYKLPDSPGQHSATLMGSFSMNTQISGADISPDGKTMVLLSSKTLWIFYDFIGNAFFSGGHTTLDMPFTQKEGVVFSDNETLLMVDNREENPTHGKLYRLAIPNIVSSIEDKVLSSAGLQVFPNPAVGPIQFQSDQLPGAWTLEVLTVSGSRAAYWSGNGSMQIEWPAESQPGGVYFYRLLGEGVLPSSGKLILQ